MKRNICVCLTLVMLVTLLATVPSVSAAATRCAECEAQGLTCTDLSPIEEYVEISATQHAQYLQCNNGHKQLRKDSNGNYVTASNHEAAAGETTCSKCGAQFEPQTVATPTEATTAPTVAASTVYCASCQAQGLVCTEVHTIEAYAQISTTQHAQYFECNNGHKQLRTDSSGNYLNTSSHAVATGATLCNTKAVCAKCGGTFESHDYGTGVVTAATCTQNGYTTYTCKVCKKMVITNTTSRLSHWYAEWQPAGNGKNSAPCKRTGCTHTKTTDCVEWDFTLLDADGKAQEYTVCPVCGETSDDTRLELVENVTVKPITGWTPEGDLVFRMGELANGEKIVSVSFEYDAHLAQCTGLTDFIVPGSVVEGYKVMLLDDEGGETELDVTSGTSGTSATITLDFSTVVSGSRIPVRMLHLVPDEA